MQQPIILVAAMSRNRVIGRQNRLPWHLPADLSLFKKITKGKTVIMGRKTLDSMGGKPLPHRRNIIVTRTPDKLQIPNCETANNLEMAIQKAKSSPGEIMIIGGQTIYEQALPFSTDIYLSLINTNIEGDTFFPEFTMDEWKEVERTPYPANSENEYSFDFIKFKKRIQTKTS